MFFLPRDHQMIVATTLSFFVLVIDMKPNLKTNSLQQFWITLTNTVFADGATYGFPMDKLHEASSLKRVENQTRETRVMSRYFILSYGIIYYLFILDKD
jgi:hypothetical protein